MKTKITLIMLMSLIMASCSVENEQDYSEDSANLVIIIPQPPNGQNTGQGEIEFCEYNIDLIVGDIFNIRDYVHLKDGGTLDFNDIFFTYTLANADDPTIPPDWNLDAFNNGLDVTTTAADAEAEGNHGEGRFRIYVVRNGESEFDDHATFRISNSGNSEVESAKCTN